MTEISVAGLRQAFLDPESRIRLVSDPKPEEHTELLAIAWQGGFLDEAAIHFNENLNALIGGRGSGKSTIIESIRYALNASPLGEDAQRLHQDFLKHVLRSGTKISLLVRSHYPAKREYLIERTVPSPPTVRDSTGVVTKLAPSDVVPQIDEAAWSTLYSTTSRPFDPPSTGKIAVKVINHYGDEVLKVFQV